MCAGTGEKVPTLRGQPTSANAVPEGEPASRQTTHASCRLVSRPMSQRSCHLQGRASRRSTFSAAILPAARASSSVQKRTVPPSPRSCCGGWPSCSRYHRRIHHYTLNANPRPRPLPPAVVEARTKLRRVIDVIHDRYDELYCDADSQHVHAHAAQGCNGWAKPIFKNVHGHISQPPCAH